MFFELPEICTTLPQRKPGHGAEVLPLPLDGLEVLRGRELLPERLQAGAMAWADSRDDLISKRILTIVI